MLKKFIVMGIIIFAVAYLVPALFISDGTEQFETVTRRNAEAAITGLEQGLSTPSYYKLWITKFKVIKAIEINPGEYCGYLYEISLYTYFGFEVSQSQVDNCGNFRSLNY